ncbi:MAG: S-adenosyl-L-methionine-dependent (SAM)-methyltransferase [Gammaproteobacteria bacterium]|nr:MAG: S-adenosyl-L-methionine-dependent (SAM)-methyltransferase [Gammaproteobacteria bacterium]TND07033.1 MAG: S-adenosyl-L-methionine-dependent (SAM)-methyltransferase [Gammaproteobacteria bacterium]
MRIFRRVIDGASFLIGKIKRNQRIDLPAGQAIKVNMGCGLAVTTGWINIDGSLNTLVAVLPRFLHRLAYRLSGANRYYSEAEYLRLIREHRFVYHDLAYGLPLAEGTVDFLYSSHFVEHLYRKDAEHLLGECHRVLKTGATLRISVPDLEYAISLYKMGEKDKMLSAYFFVDDDDSHYARHKYMYDYDMLSSLLRLAGFQNIRRCDYRQGQTPDIDILDNRPDESLFVEAVK